MLISSLSLPRTGSVWWAYHLQRLHPDSIILHEAFNYMVYRTMTPEGRHIFSEEYKPGYWWLSPNEENSGMKRNLCPRDITDDELFDITMDFILKTKKTIICRTHIIPLKEKYLQFMAVNSAETYYTYRENVEEQLASLTISKHTMEFVVFNEARSTQSDTFNFQITNLQVLEDFCNRMCQAEFLVDKYFKNCIKIKHENMPFETSSPGMPKKQNLSAFDRLCESDQRIIKEFARTLR